MRREHGQATIEWTLLVVVMALALGALASTLHGRDGRSFAGFLAHRIVCAVKMGCDDGDAELERAYGQRDARLVRRNLPGLVFEPGERQIPVDWRECRNVNCALVPDDQDLDAHRSDAGARATVFTRLLRDHGRLHIQYWLYYPESRTAYLGAAPIWLRDPLGRKGLGYHLDDWEGIGVRLDRGDAPLARVTSHGHWQWCKHWYCRGLWGPATGWARVSRGSHSAHVPLDPARERTVTAEGIRIVPLEGLDRRRYRRLDPDVVPPWMKDAYTNPESSTS